MKASQDEIRQQAVTEVIELGEMLFDTAIDVAAQRPAEREESDTALIDEMRAAANEFFMALRLLLETRQETGERNQERGAELWALKKMWLPLQKIF